MDSTQQGKNKTHDQQIPQKFWHKIIPDDYTIKNTTFTLSPEQVAKLIQSQSSIEVKSILNEHQIHQIEQSLASSPKQAIYVKVNGRTPKDLPYISREVRKPHDLIQILHSSEYILQVLHKNQEAEVILREFIPEISHNNNIYDIFVRGGFIVAIGQKFCDHIQQQPGDEEIKTMIDCIQIIMPAITMTLPKGAQLNAFLVSAYCKGDKMKITSILQYPPYHKSNHQIFSEEELEKYYKQIIEEFLHKSQQQKYEQNEGVIPLIRTIKKQQDIKHYDMGAYLTGHEIDTQQKLKEWKQFIKQANGKISQD